GYTPVEITTYTLILGTTPLLFSAPGFLSNVGSAPLPATLLLLYLGTVPIAVAYSTWAWVLARMDASRAASFLYLIPVIATLVGALTLREIPSPLALAGGALVLAGVVVVTRFGR